MKAAALQFNIAWEDRQTNYSRVGEFAKQAADQGTDMLVLPEMFATGFSMNPANTKEPMGGPTWTFIQNLAQKHRMGIIGGLVLEKPNTAPQNVALAVDRNGDVLACYAKTHLFSAAGEHQHHAPGEGPVPFVFDNVRIGTAICYDLRFPELFRQTAKATDVVFVIASWPSVRRSHWDRLLCARALENLHYVVGVNRVGHGGGMKYDGGTSVFSPTGDCLAQVPENEESLCTWSIQPEVVAETRKNFPFLNDIHCLIHIEQPSNG